MPRIQYSALTAQELVRLVDNRKQDAPPSWDLVLALASLVDDHVPRDARSNRGRQPGYDDARAQYY